MDGRLEPPHATQLRDGFQERGTRTSQPERAYAPRRGRFGLRAGGPTIFSGPSRSSSAT